MKSLVLLVATGLGLLSWAVLAHRPAPVELCNATGIGIDHLELRVDGRIVATGALPQGSTDRHPVPARQEGPLTLGLHFADGRVGEFQAGWFSPGQAGAARLVLVSPDSLRVDAW